MGEGLYSTSKVCTSTHRKQKHFKNGIPAMAARSLARAGFLRVTVLGDWGESSIWVPMLSRNSKMSVRRMPRLPSLFRLLLSRYAGHALWFLERGPHAS